MKYFISLFLSVFMAMALPLESQSLPTSAADRARGWEQHLALQDQSLFTALPSANIGPSVCSGRVTDVDVNPNNPAEMYVAYASGGVWYSNNNGTTFTPVFDHEASLTVGDIAVNWSAHILWVGTGENNSSRSSYAGTGIYKSADGGKSWKNMGLGESQHIGRIILHPVNPNIIHVAVIGALYSDNPNRGVYSSMDGGVTWKQHLFVNDHTGAIDMVMDPHNPNVLYAATWDRNRRAWNFSASGEGTGIYKSTDSGKSWEKLTTEGSGFPAGQGAGRIGLDITRGKNGVVLYAVIDNQDPRPDQKNSEEKLTKEALSKMDADHFLQQSKSAIIEFLENNGFPEKYSADTILQLMKKGTITPKTLVDYVQDANTDLFETSIKGAEVYRSDDGGRTWNKTHAGYVDDLFYTYGYYFGQIRISRTNPDKVYILGVPMLKSVDGGKTWRESGGDNVHGDHHALWIDPRNDDHLVLGNDGGINISFDGGDHWIKCNQPQVGQFYSIAVDMAKPYNIYGGLQDNNVWVGPSNYEANTSWQSSGNYPYKILLGGDGMQVAVDTRDNNTVYTGFQFGNYSRVTRDRSSRGVRITPKHELGEHPYRWNWETPIHLSVHNQDILYMGAERVFRSFDQGQHFKPISGDLTAGGRHGNVPFGTLVSLTESPVDFGLLYAGSDDGLLHVSEDGGDHWKKISAGLPQGLWVSSVEASRAEKSRVYTSLNGYRNDHFGSYVYVSEDHGEHWTRICTDLPAEPVNVIREDPLNANILYIGTDAGLYVSLDRGQHSMVLSNLPSVAVHDLVVHPRDKELVVATHGRSVYKINVAELQQLIATALPPLSCFNVAVTANYSNHWGTRSAAWMSFDEPTITFPVFTLKAGTAQFSVYRDSLEVFNDTLHLQKGLAYYPYNLQGDSVAIKSIVKKLNAADHPAGLKEEASENGHFYLPPGKYKALVRKDGKEESFAIAIKSTDED